MLVSICLARTALGEKARMENERDRLSSEDEGPPDLRQLSLLSALEAEAPAADTPSPTRKASKPTFGSRSRQSLAFLPHSRKWGIAAAILVAGVVGIIVLQMHRSAELPTLVRAIDAQLDGSQSIVTPSMVVPEGRHSLDKGLLELKLAGGATVALQGPAQFEVVAKNLVSLTGGRLSASVPHDSSGLSVQTPDAVTVDLGTEFGVAVVPGTSTHVEVFEGRVRTLRCI